MPVKVEWEEVKRILIAHAPVENVRPEYSVGAYFKRINNTREQARQYLESESLEYAYTALLQIANLTSATVPKHPKYNDPAYKLDRKRCRRYLEEAVGLLEKLTEKLKARYEDCYFLDEEETRQKEEADARLLESQSSIDIPNARVASPSPKRQPSVDRWSILRVPGAESGSVSRAEVLQELSEIGIRLRQVRIPLGIMDAFLEIACPNTENDIETCGILTGKLVGDAYHVTTLIIPKQRGTSNTVVTYDEEKLIDIQIDKGLVTLGWIHTHPSQSCFMSSVDLHTHFGYEIMLPEAIAIVLAPSDKHNNCGIFSIRHPDGMNALKDCPSRGFHQHDNLDEIYGEALHAYFDPNIPSADIISLTTITGS